MKKIPVISLDDPNAANALAQAIDAKPGDTIEIVTPQFTREPGAPPARQPPAPFESVRSLDFAQLKELGCRCWDDPDKDGTVLMLLPGEWYDSIPEGFMLECIDERPHRFEKGESDNDILFGVLAYGIRVKKP